MTELTTRAVKLQRPMVRIREVGWRELGCCSTLTPKSQVQRASKDALRCSGQAGATSDGLRPRLTQTMVSVLAEKARKGTIDASFIYAWRRYHELRSSLLSFFTCERYYLGEKTECVFFCGSSA
jgi:hypothetical protein